MTAPNFDASPFATREFKDVLGKQAMCKTPTEGWILVRVKDWISSDYSGDRKLEVMEDGAFCRSRLKRHPFGFLVQEAELIPVDTSHPNWFETFKANQLEEALKHKAPFPSSKVRL